MPIGLVSPQPLNVGVTPTAPVTVAAPVVTPDAVGQLVDAFRKGVVTSQDLVSHIGTMATAKNRTLLQEMKEYTSPNAIESRQSALQAQTAQNNLAQQTAEAQSGLVQPTAQLAGIQTQRAVAGAIQGPQGLQALQQYGPWFGENMDDFRNQDGTYDFQGAAKRGTQMAGQMNLANMWLQRLTPAGDRVVQDAAGNKAVQKVNSFGVDVTPPGPQPDGSWYPGSEAYRAYVKQLDNYLPDAHPARANYMFTPHKGANAGAAPGIYNSTADATAANSAETPPPLVTPSRQPVDEEAPMIIPESMQAQPQPLPEPAVSSAPGLVTEQAKGSYQTPQEIRTALVNDPGIKPLLEQQKYANNFKTIADAMETTGATVPGAKAGVQSANDIGLAESIIKLYDPQAALREFKWDKMEEAQPWLEKIGAWKQLVLKNGAFTPESRQRLIKMGDEIINGSETAARGRLTLAKTAAENSAKLAGQDPNAWTAQTLTSDEQRILAGQPFRTPKTPAAPAAAASPSKTLGGKRVVTFSAGPYAGRQMLDNGDGSFTPVQ